MAARAGVAHAIAQDGDGQAGLFGIEGDKGRERFEGDFDGKRSIVEIDARERKLAGEGGACQTGEPGRVRGAEAVLPFVGRSECALPARERRVSAPAGLNPDGRERVRPAELPLSGRLKISQSRNWPRPPSLMLPAPTPPSGKEIMARAAAGEDAGIGDVAGLRGLGWRIGRRIRLGKHAVRRGGDPAGKGDRLQKVAAIRSGFAIHGVLDRQQYIPGGFHPVDNAAAAVPY